MRPIRVTVGSATSSNVIPMDRDHASFQVSVAVALSAGADLTYTVEHTFDDVFAANFDPSTAVWFPNTGLSSKTASAEGNYTNPVTGIRLRVSAYTSGSAMMTIIQSGTPGE